MHENDVAEAFARRMAGPGVTYKLPPHEGKIDFIAEREGLFSVNAERMFRFNMLPEIMVASRQDATVVGEGARLAGTRAIPLYFSQLPERRFRAWGKAAFGLALAGQRGYPCYRDEFFRHH
ncbi:MAG: hypothetical protein ACLUPV_10610 [Bilophila wadsworthia]